MYFFLHTPLNVDRNNNTAISVSLGNFLFFSPGWNLPRGVCLCARVKKETETQRGLKVQQIF